MNGFGQSDSGQRVFPSWANPTQGNSTLSNIGPKNIEILFGSFPVNHVAVVGSCAEAPRRDHESIHLVYLE